MCTRTPTQEQKQFLDQNINIYRGLINKSAPLASLKIIVIIIVMVIIIIIIIIEGTNEKTNIDVAIRQEE